MKTRAMLALLAGTIPLIGLTQLDAQPTTNLMGNASNGSNVAANMANDSTDADTPPSNAANMATNSSDDAPPK